MNRSPLPSGHAIARRTLLQVAGLGAGGGLVGGFPSTGQGGAETASPASARDAPIWSGEYWAKKGEGKGEVNLNLWRKRVGAPKAGEPPPPVLFLVHGSSNSARTSFDLAVPGKGEYSLMNVFARYGYDVWTMDHDGYGHSGSSGNNSDIASSVADLKAAVPVLLRETGAEAMADEELKFGDQVPTGTYLDMTANLPLVDPTKILAPVAMIRGDHDGIATMEDLFEFYRQLPNGDRLFITLPSTAHSPGYANNRHLLWYATRAFLAAPAPAAS
jgi:pimeloyl-ACP methyl ester carboxylesterase